MMTTSFIKDSIVAGASVIGSYHQINGKPNQDYFRIKRNFHGISMTVCDGVGSNKYSHYGSKSASISVTKVFKKYSRGKINKEMIGEQIELYYKKYLRKKYRNYASTTCLFSWVFYNGEIIIGQAGDGIILIKKDNRFLAFKDKTDDFLNEVNALSYGNNFKEWKIKNLKFDLKENSNLEMLLSTDGISDDVIPEKREIFFDYFIGLSTKKSKSKIKKVLENWNVPGSTDDKTVITFAWRRRL